MPVDIFRQAIEDEVVLRALDNLAQAITLSEIGVITVTSTHYVGVENVILCNATSDIYVYLPVPTETTTRRFFIKNISNKKVTIKVESGEYIDEYEQVQLIDRMACIEVISDQQGYYVVGQVGDIYRG